MSKLNKVIHISDALHAALLKCKQSTGRNVRHIVDCAIRQYLKREGKR